MSSGKRRIVVIGSGIGGSVVSNALAKNCDVLLLERGSTHRIEFPDIVFHHKRFGEVRTACFGSGGTTNLWHNGLMPIRPGDITEPTFRHVLQDAASHVDEAASELHFPRPDFSSVHSDLVARANEDAARIHCFNHGVDCLVYPAAHTRRLAVGPDVKAIYGVNNIEFETYDDTVSKVLFHADGRKESIAADVFIVSAGSLGTPRLLSKLLESANLAQNTTGCAFIDHPIGFVGKCKVRKSIEPVIKRFCLDDKGSYTSRSAIRLKSGCGKYTACVFFRPAMTMKNDLEVYKFKSGIGASSGIERLRKAISLKLLNPDVLAEVVAHVSGIQMPGRVYSILFVAEQKKGSSRVWHEGDTAHVDWSVSDQELDIYRSMLIELDCMLRDICEEVSINCAIDENWLWSGAHHSSTTMLGEGADARVDSKLKVRNFRNVYVCDGSVVQEHSYANTGLTIAQLALKLKDQILYG